MGFCIFSRSREESPIPRMTYCQKEKLRDLQLDGGGEGVGSGGCEAVARGEALLLESLLSLLTSANDAVCGRQVEIELYAVGANVVVDGGLELHLGDVESVHIPHVKEPGALGAPDIMLEVSIEGTEFVRGGFDRDRRATVGHVFEFVEVDRPGMRGRFLVAHGEGQPSEFVFVEVGHGRDLAKALLGQVGLG